MNTSPHIAETIRTLLAAEHPALEKAESLVEMAYDLQKKPKALQDLVDALALYDQALELAGDDAVARSRALAGKGGALRRMPGTDGSSLEAARACFDEALLVLRQYGEAEEVAEIEMSLGLVLQALAAQGLAPLQQAVQAYHRALKIFGSSGHPREYATIHNNLATAYLSMKLSPEREVMREAMAVQSFQEALKVVNLIEDPTEYAMLQNNLGNALQAMRTAHPLENLLRAVEAYDEALKVRTRHDTPVEYANTVTNKANALMNLPDDPERSELGNPRNLAAAVDLLSDAQAVYLAHEIDDRAQIVGTLKDELLRELTEEGAPA